MTTGTEGNDVLANNRLVLHEVVDALGGDDLITVLEPDSAMNPMNDESVTVNGGAGFDTLILNIGRRTLFIESNGFDGNLAVRVSQGNVYPIYWTSIERLEISTGLGGGNFNTGDSVDILRLGFGLGGSINTGAGNDEIYFSDQPGGGAAVTARGGAGNDIIDYSATTGATVGGYRAFGGEGNDRLVGSAYTDQLVGDAGNDNLLLYQGGDDVAQGGAGHDIFFFGAALASTDFVTGGADFDTLVVQGNYACGLVLSANVTEIEGVSVLAGSNINFGESGANSYDYSITTHDSNFAAGVRAKINGAALLATEDFTFDGSAETDAHFVVYGSRGVDTLTGGFGNDIFLYAEERFALGDTVNGGPGGYDGLFFRGNYVIDFNAPGYHGLLTSIENMTLTSATDERYARGGGTEFDYNIKLADSHLAAGVTLTVSGSLLTASETMILDGSLESDGILNLFGGAASDALKGGGQGDLLHGNLGADLMTGGGGADVFRYQSTAESTAAALDRILDFTPGTDKIDLSRVDANSVAAGDQAFNWIGSSPFSASAGQLRAYQDSGIWYVAGDTDGDTVADFIVQLDLAGPTPLSVGDFIL